MLSADNGALLSIFPQVQCRTGGLRRRQLQPVRTAEFLRECLGLRESEGARRVLEISLAGSATVPELPTMEEILSSRARNHTGGLLALRDAAQADRPEKVPDLVALVRDG